MKHIRILHKAFATAGISFFLVFALHNPALTQTWIEQFPVGTVPTARYLTSAAYDELNDRLMFFSGDDLSGVPRPQDVWVLVHASGVGGNQSWMQLTPLGGPPPDRVAGPAVYDPVSNSLILHGGCTANCSPARSDTWVLSNANGLGGPPVWTQLPNAPVARASHSSAYDPGSNRMIIFGGDTAFFNTNRNDVWVLTDANGNGSPAWAQLFPTGVPPAPRQHAAVVYDQATNRFILFGGAQFLNSTTVTNFNDVWILTNANGLGGTPQWIQVTPTGTPPAARLLHFGGYDPATNRLTVFGGYFDQRPTTPFILPRNDVWVLTEANGTGGTPEWVELQPSGALPLERFGFPAGFSSISNRLLITMGRNDQANPRYINDLWVLTNANGLTTTKVSIDIKPDSFPNSVNPKNKGVIPVAILTTSTADGEPLDFDATTVDPLSVAFGPDGAMEAHEKGHVEDVDGDGDNDLVLHFRTQETGVQCGDTSLSLTGETLSGQMIEGSDSVRTVGCK